MKFERVLSASISSLAEDYWYPSLVAASIDWRTCRAEVRDFKTKAIIFEQDDVEVPAQWSQSAADNLANKYFRKAGVPYFEGGNLATHGIREQGLPTWLCASEVLETHVQTFGRETSARQVFHRMSGCWTYWGWKHGYFQAGTENQPWRAEGEEFEKAEQNAQVFYDEMFLVLAKQYGAPNSPQWFNTGLHWAYGIRGKDNGQWYVPDRGEGETTASIFDAKRAPDSYERPQPHACFLTGIEDNLVGENGIMETWNTEARIFKYGSGSGVNISPLRSKWEKLSGGGRASGIMGWLKIGDATAGAIASGGTTRRAAKMVMVDDDHPELLEFIQWKEREEHKAASMFVGSKLIEMYAKGSLAPELHSLIPLQTKARLDQGFPATVFGIGYEEEANRSIDGQNSNNSVRLTDAFMDAAARDSSWSFKYRTSEKRMSPVLASGIWSDICRASWASADPGIIFDDTVNAWNTCAADGRIRTTNPCAEFHHLDWSACNLASLKLTAFILPDASFDVKTFIHVCRLLSVVLDISVTMASFPAPEFAVGAYNYRTFGLGYMDLGGLLMELAIPYGSDEGRQLAACITSLMTATAYKTSAEMAKTLGPFPRWEANKPYFNKVMSNHGSAHLYPLNDDFQDLNVQPYCVARNIPMKWNSIYEAGIEAWDDVCHAESFRNAQATLIAPTGTIYLVADATTSGMEPDFALVKMKNLAGGGNMFMVNKSVGAALYRLGYEQHVVEEVVKLLKEGRPFKSISPGKIGEPWPDHVLKVFECANELSPDAHIKMLAAIQPFLSGAASKTINMPEETTIQSISDTLRRCHELGIKAVALYRNNSKLAQPLEEIKEKKLEGFEGGIGGVFPAGHYVMPTAIHTVTIGGGGGSGPAKLYQGSVSRALGVSESKIGSLSEFNAKVGKDGWLETTKLGRGAREYLPWRREGGYTQKTKIGDRGKEQSVFWHAGNYEDGRLGEIYIELAKQGSMMRAAANCIAIAVSIGLQCGVSLDRYVDEFIGVKFEPEGFVEGHDEINFASSFIDMIFRDLAITYLGRDDLRKSTSLASVSDPTKIVALDRTAMAVTTGARPTGDGCPKCGGQLVQDGKCKMCTNCAYNEGCSG